MGKIYEHIRRDIEKLKQVDNALKNKEPISMDDIFETSIALKKIQYVYVYAEHEHPELFDGIGRFPGGEIENFNLPENFEDLVNSWEDSLGEEKTNVAIRHLNLQDEAQPYVPELADYNPKEYYNYVNDTLNDICEISSRGRFGISREGVVSLSISAHQEFVKTCKEQDYAFNPKKEETEEIQDFVYNPVETVISNNIKNLVLDDRGMHEPFIKEHTKEFENLMKAKGIRRPLDDFNANYVTAEALSTIRKAEVNPKALGIAIKESITKFVNLKNERKDKTSLGEFIFKARERTESIVFDKVVPLGDDPDSKFIKDFLTDPIVALENSYANDGNEKNRQLSNQIHNERDNYTQAWGDKTNLYASMQIARQSRFESLFNQTNPNLNPATFKTEYHGSAFERLLNRTSPEWTSLSDYIDSWKNINVQRDLNHAEGLAQNYLRHKFPNVEPKDVTEDMVSGLRGAGRERGLFCLSLVQSKLQAEEEINQTIYDEAKQKYDSLEKRLHRGQSFADQLGKDINENEIQNNNDDNLIENNNIIIDNDMKK